MRLLTMPRAVNTVSTPPHQVLHQAELDRALTLTTSNLQDQLMLLEELLPIRAPPSSPQLPKILHHPPTPPQLTLPATPPLLPPLTEAHLVLEHHPMGSQEPLDLLLEQLDPLQVATGSLDPLVFPLAIMERAEPYTEQVEPLDFHHPDTDLQPLLLVDQPTEPLELAVNMELQALVHQSQEHLDLTPAVFLHHSVIQDSDKAEPTIHSKPKSFEND